MPRGHFLTPSWRQDTYRCDDAVVPVVDAEERFVGIVRARDLLNGSHHE